MTRTERHVQQSVIVCLAVAFALVMLLLVWLLNPAGGVRYADGATTIDQTEYHSGDIVTITTPEYCNDGHAVTVTRKIGNELGALILQPIEFYAPAAPVCISPSQAGVMIPSEIPPGRWQIIIESTYQANPVRRVTLTVVTPMFTVIPR